MFVISEFVLLYLVIGMINYCFCVDKFFYQCVCRSLLGMVSYINGLMGFWFSSVYWTVWFIVVFLLRLLGF